jgi:predicted amidohydrolase YtcJ
MDDSVRGVHAFRTGPGGWIADADSRECLTMDAGDRMAQALAIEGDKIVAVGSDAEVRRLAGPDTSIIDLGGRTVIPGLNDTHIHAIRGGQTFRRETYWYDAASLEDALARMKDAAAKPGGGKWVMVAGSWSPAQFTETARPL